MNYIATLGSEPAPVAIGYLLLKPEAISSVILIPENKQIYHHKRSQFLVTFLQNELKKKRSNASVFLAEPLKAESFNELVKKMSRFIGEKDFVNITGGSKRFSLAALEAAHRKNTFTINATKKSIFATFIDSTKKTYNRKAISKKLTTKAYLNLYHSDPKHPPKQKTFDFRLQINNEPIIDHTHDSVSFTRVQGRIKGVFLYNNHPFVLDSQAIPKKNSAAFVRRHRELSKHIAGGFATPIYYLDESLSDYQKQLNDLKGLIKTYGGALLNEGKLELDYSDEFASDNAVSKTSSSDFEPLDKNKCTLLAIVTEQVVPCLIGQHISNAEQLYILCTAKSFKLASRFKSYFSHLEVKVLPCISIEEPEAISGLVKQISEYHKELHITINDGSTLMAASMYLNAESAHIHCIDINHVHYLNSQKQAAIPELKTNLKDILSLYNVTLKRPAYQPSCDEELYQKALKCLSDYQAHKGNIELLDSWDPFKSHWLELLAKSPVWSSRAVNEGDANEYACYFEFCKALEGTTGQVFMNCELQFLDQDSDELHLECDIIVLLDGRLLMIEAKNQLTRAFSPDSHPDSKQKFMTETFGDYYAKSLIIAAKQGHKKFNSKSLQAIQEDEFIARRLSIAL